MDSDALLDLAFSIEREMGDEIDSLGKMIGKRIAKECPGCESLVLAHVMENFGTRLAIVSSLYIETGGDEE